MFSSYHWKKKFLNKVEKSEYLENIAYYTPSDRIIRSDGSGDSQIIPVEKKFSNKVGKSEYLANLVYYSPPNGI